MGERGRVRVEVRIRTTEGHELVIFANLETDVLGRQEALESGLEHADQVRNARTGKAKEAERFGSAAALEHPELAAVESFEPHQHVCDRVARRGLTDGLATSVQRSHREPPKSMFAHRPEQGWK